MKNVTPFLLLAVFCKQTKMKVVFPICPYLKHRITSNNTWLYFWSKFYLQSLQFSWKFVEIRFRSFNFLEHFKDENGILPFTRQWHGAATERNQGQVLQLAVCHLTKCCHPTLIYLNYLEQFHAMNLSKSRFDSQ